MPDSPTAADTGENAASNSQLAHDILASTRAIEQQLQALNRHPFIAVYGSTSRMLLLQLMKGAAFGLGSVLGASVVVSLIVYLMSQIQFVPIIGELIKQIMAQLQH